MRESPYETQYTRDLRQLGPEKATRNMLNRKPYRTKQQKAAARATAQRCKGGWWVSSAPVSCHEFP